MAVRKMKGNKCPRFDGLTYEFYKVMWGQIKDPLFDMYNNTIEQGELCNTAKLGIFSLIDKGGRDPLDIPNW